MAMAAVADYIDLIEQNEGAEAAHIAWKRVQAGYILAEGLPTTPESPSLKVEAEGPFPRTETEAALLEIFAAKASVAHKIHCNSRLKIGRRSLVNWLEPKAFADRQWQKEFLQDLGNCKPWVIKGDSQKSRLVKELSWEGKMFGSFTQTEVEIVKAWIDELDSPIQTLRPDPKVYYDFTKQSPKASTAVTSVDLDILVDYPVLSTSAISRPMLDDASFEGPIHLEFSKDRSRLQNFLSVWFASPTLLEALPSVPVRAADAFGSALVRVLRAQTGFDVEGQGVAGMDEVHRTDNGQAFGIVELGLEMCARADVKVPANLKEAVALGNAESVAFSKWMISLSMQWLTHRDLLIGMSWAFAELHDAVAGLEGLLSPKSAQALKGIVGRERAGLEICKKEIMKNEHRRMDFEKGLVTVRRAIRAFSI
jgi:hypothetical protein